MRRDTRWSGVLLVISAALSGCGPREGDSSQTSAPPASESAAPVAPHRVYVTNELSGNMSVIDGVSQKVIATVPLGKRPRGIQVSPDGKQLFVALSGSPIVGPDDEEDDAPPADKSADGIGVVDIASHELLRVIRGVSDPEQLVVHPDGRRMYIASEDTGTAVVVDIESEKVLATLPVGGEPEGVGITPDGRFVYVTSEEDNQVAVIDTSSDKVVKTFKVGERPRAAAFLPDGSRAYVTGEFDGTVAAVDVTTHTVTQIIQLTGDKVRPMEVDLSPDGSRAYVTTGRGRTLVAVDTSTQQPVASVTVGPRPWGLALSPDGTRLYTANGPSNDVSIVDAASFKVIATVTVGTSPWGVVAVPGN